MATIHLIVEGDGEVAALPLLLRRLRPSVNFATPQNAHGKQNLIKQGGIEKFLERTRIIPQCAGVMVLLDADQDCPRTLALDLAGRARLLQLPFPTVIVCAKCEYEAWFLASMERIASHFDIPEKTRYEGDVEARQGAKGWISQQMPPGRAYKPEIDQAPMTALLDPDLVRPRSRSFRRLEHALDELLTATEPAVTPLPNRDS